MIAAGSQHFESPVAALSGGFSNVAYLSDDAPVDVAVRRLNGLASVQDVDSQTVRRHTGPALSHRIGADLGDDSDVACRLMVSGWACRVRDTPWGGRQILDFVLPGDSIGLSINPPLGGLYRIVALTRGFSVNATGLRDLIRDDPMGHPALRAACLREERVRAVRILDHTARLGGVSATQAMAHLLLELRRRLAEVDLLQGDRFPMPLSQEALHEALGITVTQVYRILTQLRRDGLIRLGPGWAEIKSPEALAEFAGLDPRKA